MLVLGSYWGRIGIYCRMLPRSLRTFIYKLIRTALRLECSWFSFAAHIAGEVEQKKTAKEKKKRKDFKVFKFAADSLNGSTANL